MAPPTPPPTDLSALSPLARQVAETMARVASDIALVIDHDGVIRDVAEGEHPLPASCEAWIGRRWVDTVTTDTRPKIELLLGELASTGVTQRREVNHPNVEGESLPVAWTAIRLGEHGPVVAVGRDLRAVAAIQRRFLDTQHEMELDYWQRRHADSRYRLLFQVASDAVLVLCAESLEVLEANDAARALLPGAGGLTGRALPTALPATARAAVTELMVSARATGRAGEIRVRLPQPGGHWDFSATPFRAHDRLQLLVRVRRDHDGADDDGAVAMMRALVESTPDAVVVTDSAGRILLSNAAFTSLAHQGGEVQLKGRLLADVVGDRDGSWSQLMARTRLQGLCSRMALQVMHGALSIAVEVSSTLLAEGEQEHLGFTVRAVEPRAVAAGLATPESWTALSALRAQVGLAPLDALMREATELVERRFIESALSLGGGRVDAAARLLGVDAQTLTQRMISLSLRGGGNDDDGDAPPVSVTLN